MQPAAEAEESSSESPPPGQRGTLLSDREAWRAIRIARVLVAPPPPTYGENNSLGDFQVLVRGMNLARPHHLLTSVMAARTTADGDLQLLVRFRFAPPTMRDGAAPGLPGLIVEAELTVNRHYVQVVAWPDLSSDSSAR